MSLRRSITALSVALCICLGGATAPAAAAGPRDLEARKAVGGVDTVVARFKTATCKRGKRTASRKYLARSESTNGDYVLGVLFDEFRGYRQYPLSYGPDADPYVTVAGPDGRYSSLVGPPFLRVGGALKFAAKGKGFSLGLVGAFNQGLTDGVALAGAVDCKYPKKPKKKPKKA